MKVFVDLDDTICDFATKALKEGILYESEGDKHGYKYMLDQTKIHKLGYSFYKSLDRLIEPTTFFERMLDLGFDIKDIKFLTAPVDNSGSLSGKYEWLRDFYYDAGYSKSDALSYIIMCDKDTKKLLARNDRILIDDNLNNCADWLLEGGKSIIHENWNKTFTVLKGM